MIGIMILASQRGPVGSLACRRAVSARTSLAPPSLPAALGALSARVLVPPLRPTLVISALLAQSPVLDEQAAQLMP